MNFFLETLNVDDVVLVAATGSQFTKISSIEENKVNFTNGGWAELNNLRYKPGTQWSVSYKYIVDISKVENYKWGNMVYSIPLKKTINDNAGKGHYKYKVESENGKWTLYISTSGFHEVDIPSGKHAFREWEILNTYSSSEEVIKHLLKELNGGGFYTHIR